MVHGNAGAGNRAGFVFTAEIRQPATALPDEAARG
jgi:hypothetical protein